MNIFSLSNKVAAMLRGARFERNRIAARALGGMEDSTAPQRYELSGNHATSLRTKGRASISFVTANRGTPKDTARALGIIEVNDATCALTIQPQTP